MMSRKLNRRDFLGQFGSMTAATLAAGVVSVPPLPGANNAGAEAATMGAPPLQRRQDAYHIRQQAASYQRTLPLLDHRANGDEDRYPNRIASYTKGLPHNELGEVDLAAYRALLNAVASGQFAAFEALSLSNQAKLSNPLAAYAFELEGADPHQLECRVPPTFESAETAGEMIELYWQALTRDVQFSAYETHPLTIAAAAELSKCSDFRGPKVNNTVTPATLFRGNTPGDLSGPYLSQFLWLDVPAGTLTTVQRNRVTVSGADFMTSYPEWLALQRGVPPTRTNVFDPTPRYLHSGRALAEYVHRDFTYQAYLHACLILLAMRAPLKSDNPYTRSLTQSGFVTFGAPHVLDLVARVANAALKASWCHKWLIHRRLRPEEFAGRIHNHLSKTAHYPLHEEVLNARVLSTVQRTYGSYLLPMAYPEGCPTHPAYPAGHAAIAGACTTVLKAFFSESFVIPQPVTATPDGLALVPYKGEELTVGGELNKLASNIALGRNTAGVHWRSDAAEGLKLGEAVAMGILTDLRATCPEPFSGFSFTKFDGVTITL
ncbi:MAG TPA: vanadium-dependent haloperoxidase [Methylomirabilota bacterium]|nr:vanadium-dependent haloperoxidase [Methylomirabilota bacterium]